MNELEAHLEKIRAFISRGKVTGKSTKALEKYEAQLQGQLSYHRRGGTGARPADQEHVGGL